MAVIPVAIVAPKTLRAAWRARCAGLRVIEYRREADVAQGLAVCVVYGCRSLAFLRLAEEDVAAAVRHFNASLECVYTSMHSYRVLMSVYDALLRRTIAPHPLTPTTLGPQYLYIRTAPRRRCPLYVAPQHTPRSPPPTPTSRRGLVCA